MCPQKVTKQDLQDRLYKQELAMEEMNHRFRNQLQIISNLLDIQASKTANREAHDAIRQCRARVVSIVMVHEMLRPGTDKVLRMDRYLSALAAAIAASWGAYGLGIMVEVEAETMEFRPARAAVVGLLVTELVTNSFKHAFLAGSRGLVKVEFERHKKDFRLVVSDDGRGLPSADCFEKATAGGLRLIRSLVGQLNGTVKGRSSGGAKVTVIFPA